MNWFKNLSIKAKLLASFAFVTVFSLILAIVAILTVGRIDNSYTYLLDYPQKRYEYLVNIHSEFMSMRMSSSAIVLNLSDADIVNSYWSQFSQAYNSAVSKIDEYVDNNKTDAVRDSATLKSNTEKIQKARDLLASYRANAENGKTTAQNSKDTANVNAIFIENAALIAEAAVIVEELLPSAAAYVRDVSESNTRDRNTSVILLSVLVGVIFAFSAVIAFYVSGLLSKPMTILTSFLQKAGSTGDISLRPEDIENIGKLAQFKDEIGRCIGAAASFVTHMNNVSAQLETIAGGDLSSELSQLSDVDVMGVSLNKMTGNLNSMFGEVNISAAQISAGSKQIADGAQALAQGSTEQASAIQQLSASINEIAGQTKQNARVAKEASNLSGTIRESAEKGSVQMEQMMSAVKEINEASNQINKVIKVIDDIAFQTNILALNAAVEAARAGQHGKGFAVVAEEVRNLAEKSAEAARDTGGLIENSIEKANFGLEIANETSDSLKEIVEGINRSAEIVSQIAISSDEQADSIEQINSGIDQVAQVVQQNSATAEESAAASEEMSEQARTLESLIGQFKLKDNGMNQYRLLPQGRGVPQYRF